MVPASCPGKIHWGGTRSEAASRWGHKTVSVVPKEKCLLSEHATNVEVSRSAPDDPGERCHATPASVTGRNGFRADRQCLPHGCTIPEVSTDKAEGARTSGCPSDCGTTGLSLHPQRLCMVAQGPGTGTRQGASRTPAPAVSASGPTPGTDLSGRGLSVGCHTRRWQLGFGGEKKSPGSFWSDLFGEGPSPFLHVTASNVACTGSALSPREGQGLFHKSNSNSGPVSPPTLRSWCLILPS